MFKQVKPAEDSLLLETLSCRLVMYLYLSDQPPYPPCYVPLSMLSAILSCILFFVYLYHVLDMIVLFHLSTIISYNINPLILIISCVSRSRSRAPDFEFTRYIRARVMYIHTSTASASWFLHLWINILQNHNRPRHEQVVRYRYHMHIHAIKNKTSSRILL